MKKIYFLFTICCIISSVSAQQNPQLAITFRVDVDKLRLREAPHKTAKVVAELSEGTQLNYLNETAGAWDEIELRGKKHKARWHKVEVKDDAASGWVYGGGAKFSSVYVNNAEPIPELHFDFLDISPVNMEEYEAVANQFTNPVEEDSFVQQINDSTLVVKYRNGTENKLEGRVSTDGDSYARFEYIGTIRPANVHIVSSMYYEAADMKMLDIRNGTEVSVSFGEIPVLSADQQWLAVGWAEPYEDTGGISLYQNTKKGLVESAIFTFAQTNCLGLCWNPKGDLYFKNQIYSGDNPENKYYRLQLPAR